MTLFPNGFILFGEAYGVPAKQVKSATPAPQSETPTTDYYEHYEPPSHEVECVGGT